MTSSVPKEEEQKSRSYTRYAIVMTVTIAFICGAVLLVNYLVDPLWYYQGSKLTTYNHKYNERFSKINVFLHNPSQYNCIIIGSSTATLLDAKKIDGYKCANISFSQGYLTEYADYLRFAMKHIKKLKLVVIGFDGYLLVDKPFRTHEEAPAFVRNGGTPPTAFRVYLGLEPFVASIKTLLNYTDSGRYYDGEFTASLVPWAGPYRPKEEGFDKNFRQRFGHAIGKFTTDNFSYVNEMKAIAGDAKFVAYVPPISAHYLAFLKLENKLDSYIDTIYGVSALFDSFVDFTVPSPITANPATTSDGMHYTRQINDKIAARMFGEDRDFGVRLQDISLSEYRRMFNEATDSFLAEAGIRLDQRAALRSETQSNPR
jgi:hypothetical protein